MAECPPTREVSMADFSLLGCPLQGLFSLMYVDNATYSSGLVSRRKTLWQTSTTTSERGSLRSGLPSSENGLIPRRGGRRRPLAPRVLHRSYNSLASFARPYCRTNAFAKITDKLRDLGEQPCGLGESFCFASTEECVSKTHPILIPLDRTGGGDHTDAEAPTTRIQSHQPPMQVHQAAWPSHQRY